MLIEVKSIKTVQWASEETTCYQAMIWIDGKKAIHAGNDGHGGCDMFHFADGYSGPNMDAINAWLAQNEPPMGPFESDPAKRAIYDNGSPCDLELFISRAISDVDLEKALKRSLKKICGIRDGGFYTWKAEPTAANLIAVRKAKPDVEFLNDRQDDADLMRRAKAALGGGIDDRDAVFQRQRDKRLTAADARWLLAQNANCDGADELRQIIADGDARDAQHKAESDARFAERKAANG